MRKPLPMQEEREPRSTSLIEVILLLITICILTVFLAYMKDMVELVSSYSHKVEMLTNELGEYKDKVDALEGEIINLRMNDEQQDASFVLQNYSTTTVNTADMRNGNVQAIPQIMRMKNWNPESPEVQNVTGASKEHVEELIKWIIDKRWSLDDPNHPVLQSVDTILEVESKYDISVTTQLSILTWESGFCDIYRGEDGWPEEYMSCNNAAGIDMSDGSPREFKSLDECISYVGYLLRESYIENHGLETLDEIGKRYNGPHWTNCIRETTLEYNAKLEEIINLSSIQ
mgnify:CR=1 FL=1